VIASKLWSPYLHGPVWSLSALMLLSGTAAASAQTARAREDIGRVLSLAKAHTVKGVVAGEARHHSSNTLSDVQLFIRYSWLWASEIKPGAADPRTSTCYVFYILPKEILPGGHTPFTFKPSPPLANVAGGGFDTSVIVAGFTEVIATPK